MFIYPTGFPSPATVILSTSRARWASIWRVQAAGFRLTRARTSGTDASKLIEKQTSLPGFAAGDIPTRAVARRDAIHHGLSGFGRRNSLLVIYVAAVLHANRAKLNGLKLHFSIYEMQKDHEKGSGYSCQTTSDGALNTGIPGQQDIPKVVANDLPSEFAELTDLAKCITAELEKDVDGHKARLKEENVAALKLFVDAIHDSKIDARQAFTTRGAVGQIQQAKIEEALQYIKEHMQDVITVDRHFEHEVVGVVVTNPQKPQFKVKRIGTRDEPTLVTFDFVHLANGAPARAAIPRDVLETSGHKVFTAVPNHAGVKDFLINNNLLDQDNHYVPLILQHTSFITATDMGYTIDEAKAKEYRGLLKFISHPRDSTPPRHIDANHFASPTKPILTSEDVHALLLQKHFDWLNFLDRLPRRERRALPPQAAQGSALPAAHGREGAYGLQRTGYWLLFGGQGFHANPAQVEAELVKKAPLTRKDRAGFLMRRGSLADITSLAYVENRSNKEFFARYTTMQNLITASPPAIHQLVARMFELGVVTHEVGDYEDVLPNCSPNVLFAPDLADRKADQVLKSLAGKVKEVVPSQPEYAKGRFLRVKDDEVLTHAIDVGQGGQGTRVMRATDAKDQSIVGMRWPDTAFLDAAAHGAATLAPMTVLLSSIAQQGTDKPAEKLLEYYTAGLPTAAEFTAEVEQFRPVWEEMHQKHAFLALCEEVSGNFDDYLEYTDQVFNATTRDQLVGRWTAANMHVSALKKYEEARRSIPEFNPPSVEEYFARFVDLSPSEVERCWDAHFVRCN
ncbi:hypothetical protein MSAN_02156900 [Mycena sanguinolenta]|uniref:Uncharacterized protein n=1 Tax=Mycena sanguinolenta TaxID=230812 RepID=A0A8H6XE46_9AGAR|nr:hypothetical protein MSAN_02156900 [Mycena sanguinolenta]